MNLNQSLGDNPDARIAELKKKIADQEQVTIAMVRAGTFGRMPEAQQKLKILRDELAGLAARRRQARA